MSDVMEEVEICGRGEEAHCGGRVDAGQRRMVGGGGTDGIVEGRQ